MKISFISLFR